MRTLVPVLGLLALVFAGYVKGSPLMAFIPVDLTLVGAVVVAVAVAHRWYGRRLSLASGRVAPQAPSGRFAPLLALWATFLFGVAPGTDFNPYALDKVISLFTLAALAAAGGFTLLNHDRLRAAWVWAVAVFGVAVAGIALLFPQTTYLEVHGRLAVEGTNTISMGRAIGAAVVVLVASAMGKKQGRVRYLVAAVTLAGVMVWFGSRGPVIAALLAIGAIAVLFGGPGRFRRALLATSVVLAASVAVIRLEVLPARLLLVGGDSVGARTDLWAEAWSVALVHPFGIGWGNLRDHLPAGLAGSDWVIYPHNLLLEIASEAGWLSAATAVLVLIVALQRQSRATFTSVELAMFGLLVFFIANAMVSADINGNRGLWVMVGGALAAVTEAPSRVKGAAARIGDRSGHAA